MAGYEPKTPDGRTMLDLYHAEPVANAMNARPAVQAALSMPDKVPEVLRTFGG
jgi:hypothetical protein